MVKEIEDARALFEAAEKSSAPEIKADLLKDGLDILDAYIEDSPEMPSSHRTFIKNLKEAHTRRLISQLVALNEITIDAWIDYVILLTTRLKVEMDAVQEKHPDLKSGYDRFFELYKPELLRAIDELRRQTTS